MLHSIRLFVVIFVLNGITLSAIAQCSKRGAIRPQTENFANNNRSDSIDIINYAINLNITDFSAKIISGNCDIKFTPKINNLTKLNLDLLKLTVDSVKFNSSSLSYTYNDTLLSITTPVLNIGDTAIVTVFYRGVPKGDASGWGGFYFQSGYAFNLGVGFAAEPHNYGRVWFPCFDNFVERSSYNCNITTTTGKKAFCGGLLKNHTVNTNGTETWFWELKEEIPTYLASVAVASYTSVKNNFTGINGNIPVELAALPADTTKLKASFANLNSALNIFEESYGPYLWERIGFVLVPFSSGAMEHATNIAYPRYSVDGSLTYESLMAHEFSHHWWGDLVTCETAEDMWLNEGWASYSEHLFTEGIYGRNAYLKEVKANQTDVLHYAHVKEEDYRAVSGVPHEYTYGDHVYLKGAYVAHNLRGYMGDTLFFNSLKSYLDAFKFKHANSYDFRNHLALSSGLNLDDFFNDWVFNPGFSHFSIDSIINTSTGSNNNVKVFVKQKLTGAPSLHNNVPITVTFFDSLWNQTNYRVNMSGDTMSFEFILSFVPVFTALNFDQKINDAISSETKVIKTTGINNLPNAFMNLTVSALPDSAFIRVEHNWTTPDPITNTSSPYVISPNRYWKVDGVFPNGFVASGKIAYDGRKPSSYSGSGYFDHDLILGSEDSIVLLYRANAGKDWELYSDFVKTPGPSLTDKFGNITINNLKKGEYALALKNQIIITSVSDSFEKPIKIYPNPGKDEVTLELTPGNNIVEIMDLTGKIIESFNTKNSQLTVSTAAYKNGVYQVRVQNAERMMKGKLLIIK